MSTDYDEGVNWRSTNFPLIFNYTNIVADVIHFEVVIYAILQVIAFKQYSQDMF